MQGLSTTDKLRMLLDITKKISRSLDLQEVLNLVMDTLDSLIPYDAAGIFVLQCKDPALLPEGEEPCEFKSEAVRGYDIDELFDLHLKLGEGFIGSVALSGQPIISPDVRKDPVYINARDRTRSEMVAPIISNDEVIGVFDLESDELNAYSNDDLEVLMLLASQVAIIIEKVMLHEQLIEKKRLQGQLEVARQVQLELLPAKDPELPGYDISAYNFPTEEVSGDYYDWVRIYNDEIAIVIADVAGKGVPAAILMAFLRASLRAATHVGYATNISMSKVNHLLYESIERNQFVTAFHAVLDASTRTLSYSNAGHNPPLLIKRGAHQPIALEATGMPAGVSPSARIGERARRLLPGDLLLLYTDGLSEATSPEGALFGEERLGAALVRHRDRPAREILDRIDEEISEFRGGAAATDDGTALLIKVENAVAPKLG